jgi:hypothetical protein
MRRPKRFVPASSEEKNADFNWPPADEELTQYFTNTPASPVREANPVVPPETLAQSPAHAEDPSTLDGARPGEWGAEMARLQELLERLTQKLEWRLKSVGR